MSHSSYTLLIVDDEKQNRTLLLELLKSDYRIILAKNGVQALERAREHGPDLILLDVMMPEMDGYATIHILKEDESTREIPVIFISALDSASDEEKGLELGAVDYITKPFHPSIVLIRVRNHLQMLHQRRLLEQLALLDSLTEIPNRRRFAQIFEQEWHRCQRCKHPLSLAVVDVDHFKRYNDTYGHAAGDEVLRRVAQTLNGTARRAGDFVARYGGEEFIVLLPEMNGTDAQTFVEQMRQDVEALKLPHATSSVCPWITVSIGATTLIPDSSQPDTDFFCLADSFLYQAKRDGRNRVCWGSAEARQEGN
ncbi:MAG: diguanylate cyclase [Sulfuricella sp.]|nr:diguanylate cyclase [Sulfuricella sp.]